MVSHIPRVYLAGRIGPGAMMVEGEPARHLATVLRVRPGDPVLVFAGDGREWEASVTGSTRSGVAIEVGGIARQEASSLVVLEVWCALVRATRFEWAVEKCVEAGADILRPMTTARTQRGDGASAAKMARWQRIAVEAAEQCGRLYLPVVEQAQPLEHLLETFRGTMVFGARDGRPLEDAARQMPQHGHIAIAVGPEGGFSGEETAALARAGAIPVSFGPYTLRTETAAVIGAALTRAAVASAAGSSV